MPRFQFSMVTALKKDLSPDPEAADMRLAVEGTAAETGAAFFLGIQKAPF
jgi:hypothetical protein